MSSGEKTPTQATTMQPSACRRRTKLTRSSPPRPPISWYKRHPPHSPPGSASPRAAKLAPPRGALPRVGGVGRGGEGGGVPASFAGTRGEYGRGERGAVWSSGASSMLSPPRGVGGRPRGLAIQRSPCSKYGLSSKMVALITSMACTTGLVNQRSLPPGTQSQHTSSYKTPWLV